MKHTLQFPLNLLLFGKSNNFESAELQFSTKEDSEEGLQEIVCHSCKGIFDYGDQNGRQLFDLSFLTRIEGFDKMVLQNIANWDKDYEWWLGDKDNLKVTSIFKNITKNN